MGQSELGEYADGDRPVHAEAQAVAGGDADGNSGDTGQRIRSGPDDRFESVTETVDVAVMQVDYTVEGSGDEEYPVVHIFGRTADRELVHARILEFRPYFYAPSEQVTDQRLAEYDRITGAEETDADGEPYESIRGERLTKIFGQTPRDVGRIRDDFDHYEADILFPNRLLIDKDVTSGVRLPDRPAGDDPDDEGVRRLRVHHEEIDPIEMDVTPRVNTFDIEVDDRSGFPEDGEEPIVCITGHDSYRDEYVLWLYEAPDGDGTIPDALPGYEPIAADRLDVEVRSFASEAAMLDDFLGYFETHDADIATGWNFTDFDAPYLLDRLDVLNSGVEQDLDPDRFSRVREVWRSDWQGPSVKGRVMFDLLYAYQRTKFTELDSYRLEDVGQRELGVGKERYSGDIGDLWEDDPEQLLEYNLRDVELCVELDRDQAIIPFWNEVRQFVGCKIEDATTPGDAVDMYVLHKLHDEYVLPSKGQQESEDYEGGAVFDPITGVRENVSVLDLKCFSADTELLTPEGSRNITELAVGDPVYTLDPETLECEIKPVAETHEYPNKYGELHHLSGNTHDFKVTENHRFYVSSERGWDDLEGEDFSFKEYREIPDGERFGFPQHEPMDGRSPDTFKLVDEVSEGYVAVYSDDDLQHLRSQMPTELTEELSLAHGSSAAMGVQKKVGKYLVPISTFRAHSETIRAHADAVFLKYDRGHQETPTSFPMTAWLEFLGWFVTDGSLDTGRGRLTLHQSDADGRDAIRSLLDELGLEYSVDDRGITVSDRYLVNWLEQNCGNGDADKHLPEWVFDLDGELLSGLLETMIRGDGRKVESGLRKFWTKSDRLKDDVVDLAVRCGEKPTVSNQSDGTWYVSIGKAGSFKKATNADVESHEGSVYCVTAEDNHVVLAGRNGQFQWIGQSLYPMCMVTTNASPETKVDPETYDGDTYVAPNGTHFRKNPDGAIREMVDELLTEREEKKALRNEYNPDEDEYEQYDRQQQAVKVIMNCFTPDTEVLTPAGVQGIQELEVGDEVYSLNPETMLMETKQVTETHAYPHYRGELVDIETSKIDFSVTPNHRMLVRKNDANGITEEEWDFVEAKELYDYCHYEMPHDWGFDHGSRLEGVDLTEWLDSEYEVWVRPEIRGRAFTSELGWQPPTVLKNDIGVEGYVFTAEEFNQHREYIESVCEESFVHAEPNRQWIPRTYDGDDFLELLAWYITEGNVYTSEPKEFGENYRGSSTTIQLAQDETVLANGGESNHDRIGRLLDRMGFDYYVDGHSYQFTSELLGTFLRKECGEGSFEKRIPDVVFNVSEEQKRSFLETLIEGDGDWQTNSWRYTTSSEQLRDDVLQLCTHLGLTVNYGQNGGSWRIYCDEESRNSFRMHRDGSENTADDGVYCVTVEDNNTILAGRDGKFQNVGQSLYGVLGWDRFRLYDREMGAAVTATGREVIEFTEEVTNELEKEVIYGDSVTGDRPVVVRDPSGEVRVAPIEELFERAHDGGSARLERTDEGDIVETDPKEYRPLPGWEALSLSADGEPQWQPIERVIRHETSKDVLTLQHELGESTTTTDHAYVVDDGEYRVARPTEVNEPVRVPSLPPVDQKETVDVSELLDGCTQAYEDGRGGGEGPGDTVTKHEKLHADGEHVWVGREHHGDRDGTPKLKRFVDLQGEDGHALIRLVAASIAEGSVSTTETTDTRCGARISAEHRERLERLRADYERLFSNVTASIVESDSSERPVEYEPEPGGATLVSESKTHEIQLTDELAGVFFREVAGQTSRGKRVPSFVFHLPETEQALFLETLTGGDGARECQRNSEEYGGQDFEFETTSRELAAGVAMLLIQRGETYSLTYRQENGSYTVQTCDSHRQERARVYGEEDHDGYVYDLSVAENENFVDGVGGIVLHNTDSVMVSVGTDISKADAIDQSFELEERINESYDEFAREQLNAAEHRFQIEFEKLYRRFFQAGKKKRYSGHIIWKEGKDVDDIDITGFEHQRSDVAPITKEVQQRVLEMIVTGESTEAVKSYVHEVIEEFLDGEVELEEIGIPGGIGKRLDNYATDTAQVRGAKYANLLLGTNFGRGSKPKRVYLDRVHSDFFERVEAELGLDPAEDPLYGEFRQDPDVICFEYPDQLPGEFEIDWEKMLEKTLKGPIARILEALDISWEEVRTGQEQTGLGNFM